MKNIFLDLVSVLNMLLILVLSILGDPEETTVNHCVVCMQTPNVTYQITFWYNYRAHSRPLIRLRLLPQLSVDQQQQHQVNNVSFFSIFHSYTLKLAPMFEHIYTDALLPRGFQGNLNCWPEDKVQGLVIYFTLKSSWQ